MSNINHSSVIRLIQDIKPDLIVSAYFNQIIKEPIINLPRLGILNMHPGWLPAYRGVMAYFWVLKNGSDEAGVSIHWIGKGIDAGELVQ
ncbi:MAG: methionyl-tRNA formyltransferase [Gammaproteobacteria bacterium]|jgi:methionyl-tRNA formyltransferase